MTQYSFADLHMHTTISDGTMSPEAVVNAVMGRQLRARERGSRYLSVLAITDHDRIEGALRARDYATGMVPALPVTLEVIIGSEVTSCDGHILALGIHRDIAPGLSAEDTIAAIHAQQGLAVAAHPYAYCPGLPGLRGIGRLITTPHVGALLDAIETRNANPTEVLNNYRAQLQNRTHHRVAEVGGSDSHFYEAIGRAYTAFPGQTAADLFSAIRYRQTKACGGVYGMKGVLSYLLTREASREGALLDGLRYEIRSLQKA